MLCGNISPRLKHVECGETVVSLICPRSGPYWAAIYICLHWAHVNAGDVNSLPEKTKDGDYLLGKRNFNFAPRDK
jgi:hypothetical protein